jgi:hypothetical protein
LEPYVGLCGGNFLKPKAKIKFHRRKPTYIYYSRIKSKQDIGKETL